MALSLKQIAQLSLDADFSQAVQTAILVVAAQIAGEDPNTANHAHRVTEALSIAKNPSIASTFITFVAAELASSLSPATPGDPNADPPVDPTPATPVTDTMILTAVTALWDLAAAIGL